MVTLNQFLLSVGTVLALSSCTSAFFFGGWGTEPPAPAPQSQYYYHKRLLQGPVPYYAMNNIQDPQGIPSIPMGVPLQAKLAPTTIQNVQLVPCLCPVQQDYGYEPQQENMYLNHYQQPAQPPQQQQQQQKQTRRK